MSGLRRFEMSLKQAQMRRSLGRSRRASSGRLDPFAAQFGYDCSTT
jgi:hypothetical protein